MEYKLGDRVKILGKNAKGEIAFIGDAHFSDGTWIGIILDDPKGRNNGSVDGIRYFKCPRNHGVFVRACQIAKESSESLDIGDKESNPNSRRIRYPNYLKASSKLEANKHTCESKTADALKTKSRLKHPEENAVQANPIQNTNEVSDFQSVKDENSMLKAKLKTSDDSLQAVREENGILKSKLRSIEESLKDISKKYDKAMDEVKYLKGDIECKKTQIKVQRSHLKLLKARQCSHYKRANSFKTQDERSCQSENGDSFKRQSNSFNDDASQSDDEFSIDSLKTLTSFEHVLELEEENRIMIEGLVELREFLRLKGQSQLTNMQNPPVEICRKLKGSSGDTKSFSDYANSSIAEQSNRVFPTDEVTLKEYTSILQEMTKFSHEIKDKDKFTKSVEVQNSSNTSQYADFSSNPTYLRPSNISGYQITHNSSNQTVGNYNRKQLTGLPNIYMESPTIQPNLTTDNSNFQDPFGTKDNFNANQSFQLWSKARENSQTHCSEEMEPPTDGSKNVRRRWLDEDPVVELRRLISSLSMKSECPRTSNASSTHHELLVRELASGFSGRKSESTPDCRLPSANNAMEAVFKSSGDSASISSSDNMPKSSTSFH